MVLGDIVVAEIGGLGKALVDGTVVVGIGALAKMLADTVEVVEIEALERKLEVEDSYFVMIDWVSLKEMFWAPTTRMSKGQCKN